jgi:hypothetical protein
VRVALLVLLLIVAACEPQKPAFGAACDDDGDCDDGYVCSPAQGFCVPVGIEDVGEGGRRGRRGGRRRGRR